jgi:PAS domain S-box-containing protein
MQREQETPMWMVDSKTYRITMANRAAQKMFGYSADELATKTIFDVVIPEQVDVLRESFAQRAFAGDGGMWTLRLSDGTPFRIKIRYHYLERDGAKLQFTFAAEIYDHPDFANGKTKGIGGT